MSFTWDRPGIVPGLNECRSQAIGGSTKIGNVASDSLAEKIVPLSRYHEKNATYPIDLSSSKCNTPSAKSTTTGLLICGGVLIDGDLNLKADLLITDGKISGIAKDLHLPADFPTINASNLRIQPGAVDFSFESQVRNEKQCNTTFRIIDADRVRKMTKEAVLEGITTVVDNIFVTQEQSAQDLVWAYLQAVKTSHPHCTIVLRVVFDIVTRQTMNTIQTLMDKFDINQFMFPFTLEDQVVAQRTLEETIIFKLLQRCHELNIIPHVHIRQPNEQRTQINLQSTVNQAHANLLAISTATRCPVIISPVTKLDQLVQISMSKCEPLQPCVFTDWATSIIIDENKTDAIQCLVPFLAVDETVLLSSGRMFMTKDVYKEGATFTPSLLRSLQNEVVQHGWATEGHIIAASCTRPAKLLGLFPQKGSLSVGADADIVLWSKEDEHRPAFTIVCGQVVCRNGQLVPNLPNEFSNSMLSPTYVNSKTSAFCLLSTIQDKLAKTHLKPPKKEYSKLINFISSPKGDEPDEERRHYRGPQRQHMYSSTFKLSGEQDGDNMPARPSVRIWRTMRDSPRPF